MKFSDHLSFTKMYGFGMDTAQEKSADSLMGLLLYVTSLFTPAALKILCI